MTVTVVFGKTTDGYIHSYDTTYSTSRNGPADAVDVGTAMYVGQNHNDSSYATFESFVGYDYSAIPAGETVTAAELRLYMLNLINAAILPDIEWRGYLWSSGGLVVGDWRTPTQLSAARLDGVYHVSTNAPGNIFSASSDNLLTAMSGTTSMEHVVVTSRMRAGTTPTTDEGIALATADQGGTVYDPQMVYTSAVRSSLFGVMGAQVRLSNGWAYLESNGAATPTIKLNFRADTTGTVTTIATLPVAASGTNTFAIPRGQQALALVADPSDNLFVMGLLAATSRSLAILTYAKGSGVTWTAKTMRSTTLPTYDASVNNVVAQYHAVNGGCIMTFVESSGGAGSATTHNELQHVWFNPAPLLANATSTSPIFSSGYSMPALQPYATPAGYANSYHNQTGSGMDVADAAQTGGDSAWGYFYSWGAKQNLGDNNTLDEGRFIIGTAANSFSHTSQEHIGGYGRKDANGKIRVVPVSPTAAAFISTDSDSGWGVTILVQNHSGTNSGSTSIGYDTLSDEGIPSMPDGPVIGQTVAWDAIYNATENVLWIYYVDASDSTKLRRTGFNLNTMNATLSEILVYSAASPITAVRVQRNKPITQNTLVSIGLNASGVLSTAYAVDTFNVAPTTPTLTPKANFDASASATFAWTFNDPNPGDTQSAYQLEISKASDGTIALDTGKVTSATTSRTIAGATLTNGTDYRWRVRTWDTLDAQGPYSGYGTFTASAGGSVTITSPATDNPDGVVTDDLPVIWSVSGTVQAAYRVWLYRGATLVSDTGWIASTATTATVAGMLSDQQHEIRVQVRNASAVTTNTASRFVTPSFSVPELPIVTLTPVPDEGYVLVSIENPAPGEPALGTVEQGFEGGIGTWTASASATVAPETGIVHRGTGALRLTATATVAQIFSRDYSNKIPVTPGQRYSARMWVYRSAAGNVSPSIDWTDAAGNYLSTSGNGQTIPAATWTRVDVTGTAPTGAAFAAYGPTVGTVTSGDYLIADEVVLTGASDRPDVSRNDILRRVAGSSESWEVIGSTGADGIFRDYTATAGIVYEYRARGNA